MGAYFKSKGLGEIARGFKIRGERGIAVSLWKCASEVFDSKGTVSSTMILQEGKTITRSGRREVHRISVGMVDVPRREQSGKSAKIVGGGLMDEKAKDTNW